MDTFIGTKIRFYAHSGYNLDCVFSLAPPRLVLLELSISYILSLRIVASHSDVNLRGVGYNAELIGRN